MLAVDAHCDDGGRQAALARLHRHFEVGHVFGRPVGEHRLAAVFGRDEPHCAIGEIVIDIERAEHVAAEQP